MAGIQCAKQLWWRVHEPGAPELAPDPMAEAVFARGRRVGEAARAHVPGGVLIDLPHDAYEERVRATRAALASGAPVVYEASFRADSVYVAVDILERGADGSFCVTEVKSTTSVKDHLIPDLAIQVHVARRAGLAIAGPNRMSGRRALSSSSITR